MERNGNHFVCFDYFQSVGFVTVSMSMSMLMTLTVFGVMAVFFTTMVFLLIAISASMTLSVPATVLAMMLVFTPAFTAGMAVPMMSQLF